MKAAAVLLYSWLLMLTLAVVLAPGLDLGHNPPSASHEVSPQRYVLERLQKQLDDIGEDAHLTILSTVEPSPGVYIIRTRVTPAASSDAPMVTGPGGKPWVVRTRVERAPYYLPDDT